VVRRTFRPKGKEGREAGEDSIMRSFCTPHQILLKGKGEVVPVLFSTEHHAMKAYWGSGGIAPRILTTALDGGVWSASRPGHFTPKKISPSTPWIGGWVGPRVGLDAVVKRKFSAPAGTRIPDHPARSPALYH
jgi:hypothetical protein